VTSSLDRADVLKLNDDEAYDIDAMLGLRCRSLPEFAETAIERWGLSHCVITLGDEGAFAADEDGETAYVPGYAVDVVDTCGSGDAFTAGFVHRLLRFDELAECCELGNALGAMVATQEGATVPISPAEVDAFLAAEHERATHPDMEPFQGA
jgi:fructokinase